MNCRNCGSPLALDLIDLGSAPPSNSYVDPARGTAGERSYPLRVKVCTRCWLVQTEHCVDVHELFADDYAYFSAYSSTWVAHAREYVAQVVERFGLGAASQVVEVAANDGYLLQHVAARGIPCYGIEPTASTAAAARARGIEIVQDFFGTRLADSLAAAGRRADLMVANNVLAHVPDIRDFASGFARLLTPHGVATFEFPDVVELIAHAQFDTIYHEHFSYLSLFAAERIFEASGLRVFDVEQLPTHGGSLRVFAERHDTRRRDLGERVTALRARDAACGIDTPGFYADLQRQAKRIREQLRAFLAAARERGETVAAYGAAAKGNTLLNFAGVRGDSIAFVADRNPAKQGRLLPGSHIPIVAEAVLRERRPRWVLILPWNLRDEIIEQLAYVRSWGGAFVTAVPELKVES